jgi:hypothetical protein
MGGLDALLGGVSLRLLFESLQFKPNVSHLVTNRFGKIQYAIV